MPKSGVVLSAMKISPRELREAQIPSKAFGFNQDVVDALLERAADTIEGLIEENRQLFEALERLKTEGASAPVADPFAEVEPVAPPEPMPEPAAVSVPVDQAAMSEKEELINKTLLLAQKTSDETLRTAKAQAEEIVTNAQAQAQELVTNAKAEAETLTGAAREDAEKNVKAAEVQAQQLVADAQTRADDLVTKAQSEADAIHAKERETFVALVTQLKQEREQLLSDISILQGFDQEHRGKLRSAIESDLEKLQERPTIDVGTIPNLPEVESIVGEVVAQSKSEPPTSFDEALVEEPVAAAQELDDEVLETEEIDIEEAEVIAPAEEVEVVSAAEEDPFAAFVDADDTQVVEPAGSQLDSSNSSVVFDPGPSKPRDPSSMDDDDFFATLREAVQDDGPLGPAGDAEN